MHPRQVVDEALALCASGLTTREVAAVLGIPMGTVRHWRQGNRRVVEPVPACPRCSGAPLAAEYPYLLGAYLGDGHITVGRRQVQALSIACDDVWPGIQDEVGAALAAVMGNAVCRVA
ncbi:MAG: helix-turn-helix domain-containing protein, partial [Pseudonocardia sp.]|nr:helix-turn-helix domain-containing protein [Pseudonocardia sp.]